MPGVGLSPIKYFRGFKKVVHWGITPVFTVTPVSNSALQLDFSITGLGKTVTGIKVYHSTDGTTYSYVETLGAVESKQYTGLEEGSNNFYKIKLISGIYVSLFSEAVNFDLGVLVAGSAFDNGKIVLQFDDAWDSVYDFGLPLFQEKGIKVTTVANGYLIDNNKAYNGFYKMTWEELNLFKAAGCDVQCHGWKGNDLTLLTDEQIQEEYENNTSRFVANGLPSPLHTVYSGGYCDYSSIQQSGLYRLTGRRLRNNRTLDRYSSKMMMSCAVVTSSVEDLKLLMDEAAEEKRALVLYGHMIGVDDPLSVDLSKLEELIDYAQTKNLDFLTIPELYDQMYYLNLDLYREGLDDDEMGILWSSKLDDSYRYSLERSTDGVNFTEIFESDAGVKSYLDTGLIENTKYYYRVRAFKGEYYFNYSGIVSLSTPVSLTLTATGDGTGVSYLTILTEYDTVLSIDGNGHFYTNLSGTIGETQIWNIYRDTVNVIYIRLASGSATMKFNANYLKKFEGWATVTNSPSIGGNISIFDRIYYLKITGANTLTGDISNFPELSYLQLNTNCNGITKDVSTLTKLRYVYTKWTGAQITGSLTNLTKLYYLNLQSTDSVTGNISNLRLLSTLNITGTSANIEGSISDLSELTFLTVSGTNALSGTFTKLTKLTGSVNIGNGNTIGGLLSDIASGITSFYLGTGTTIGGSVSGLSSNIETLTINGSGATISGTLAELPRQLKNLTIVGNTITGDIADMPPNMIKFTLKGYSTVVGDMASLPASILTFNIQNGRSEIAEYTYPRTWTAMQLFYYYPYSSSITVTEAINLLIDISAATWSGGKLFHIQPVIDFSMADTNQGGIWGSFSEGNSPSDGAVALKLLAKTKTVSVALKGTVLPGATGDGTGFPAGFGNWYRS